MGFTRTMKDCGSATNIDNYGDGIRGCVSKISTFYKKMANKRRRSYSKKIISKNIEM
jgi:hypothetical protein